MSVIATSTGIDNDEELHMPQRLWDEIRESGLEKLDESMSSDSDSNESSDESAESDIDSDVDDKRMAIERMAEDMETNITRQRDYAKTIDRNLAKYEIKRKQLIESQR